MNLKTSIVTSRRTIKILARRIPIKTLNLTTLTPMKATPVAARTRPTRVFQMFPAMNQMEIRGTSWRGRMSIASKKANFRPELHGSRGLALGLVVVFHLFANGKVSGGIDIFLAITGFLFTSSLLRRVTAGNGRLDFARHFSRIGYRLLPAALLVIAAISISVFVFLP